MKTNAIIDADSMIYASSFSNNLASSIVRAAIINKIQSAPNARDSLICHGSIIKSFHNTGNLTLSFTILIYLS